MMPPNSPKFNPSRLQQLGYCGDQSRRIGAPGQFNLSQNLDVPAGEAPSATEPDGPQVSMARIG